MELWESHRIIARSHISVNLLQYYASARGSKHNDLQAFKLLSPNLRRWALRGLIDAKGRRPAVAQSLPSMLCEMRVAGMLTAVLGATAPYACHPVWVWVDGPWLPSYYCLLSFSSFCCAFGVQGSGCRRLLLLLRQDSAPGVGFQVVPLARCIFPMRFDA